MLVMLGQHCAAFGESFSYLFGLFLQDCRFEPVTGMHGRVSCTAGNCRYILSILCWRPIIWIRQNPHPVHTLCLIPTWYQLLGMEGSAPEIVQLARRLLAQRPADTRHYKTNVLWWLFACISGWCAGHVGRYIPGFKGISRQKDVILRLF